MKFVKYLNIMILMSSSLVNIIHPMVNITYAMNSGGIAITEYSKSLDRRVMLKEDSKKIIQDNHNSNSSDLPDRIWINQLLYDDIIKANNPQAQEELKKYNIAIKIPAFTVIKKHSPATALKSKEVSARYIYVHPVVFNDIKNDHRDFINISKNHLDSYSRCIFVDLKKEGASWWSAILNRANWGKVPRETAQTVKSAPGAICNKALHKINKSIVTPVLKQTQGRIQKVAQPLQNMVVTASQLPKDVEQSVKKSTIDASKFIKDGATAIGQEVRASITQLALSAIKVTATLGTFAIASYITYKYFNKPQISGNQKPIGQRK